MSGARLAGLRHLPDRLWHTRRRRRATADVRAIEVPATVLVVCHGNICRSPFAAAALDLLLPAGVRAHINTRSAGFIGAGRPCPPEAVEAATAFGVDLTGHRSALLEPAVVRTATLVLVVEPLQRAVLRHMYGRPERATLVLGDLDPEPIASRGVVDPVGEPRAAFDVCYRRLWRCVSAVARLLRPPPPGDTAAAPAQMPRWR